MWGSGDEPVILDLGTGLRRLGLELASPFRGRAFLTHLHWDHVQGLPFFGPVLVDGGALEVYGPSQQDGLAACFDALMCPPYFPMTVHDLLGDIRFVDFDTGSVEVGDLTVTTGPVPHIGATNGYRVEGPGGSMAYVPDHQMPLDGSFSLDPAVAELCADVDLLVHDSQYTPTEFPAKAHWGHCTIDYAIWVAENCGARSLALFHHDPLHGDDVMDELTAQAVACGRKVGVDVFAAKEESTAFINNGDLTLR